MGSDIYLVSLLLICFESSTSTETGKLQQKTVSVISHTAPFNRSDNITESHMCVGGNEIQAAWVTLQSHNNLLIKCSHVKINLGCGWSIGHDSSSYVVYIDRLFI